MTRWRDRYGWAVRAEFVMLALLVALLLSVAVWVGMGWAGETEWRESRPSDAVVSCIENPGPCRALKTEIYHPVPPSLPQSP